MMTASARPPNAGRPSGAWRLPQVGVLLGLLGSTAGCADPPPAEMSPEALRAIARTRGDAEGIAWSGVYLGSIEPTRCGCDSNDSNTATPAITLCSLLERLETFGIPPMIEVLQADGNVRIGANLPAIGATDEVSVLPSMYGPAMADGEVQAAGVLQTDVLFVRGQALGRFEGTIDGDDLSGDLRFRYDLDTEVVVNLDGETQIESFRCDEEAIVDVRWVSELPAPIDPDSTGEE